MKICLDGLKEGELVEIREQYDPKLLDIEFVDLTYNQPLVVEGTIEKGKDTLFFRGHLKSQIRRTCGRCLKTTDERFEKIFELIYETAGREYIEPLDDLREILILDHPMNYICNDNCLGICPQCGKDMNVETCSCQTKKQLSSLAHLREIMNRREEKSRGKS